MVVTFSTNIMELASCSVWGLNDITHKHSPSSAYYTFSIVTLGVCTVKFTLNLTHMVLAIVFESMPDVFGDMFWSAYQVLACTYKVEQSHC